MTHYTFNLRAGVKWQHILDPEQWNVLPFIAWRDEVHGVLMKAAGTPQSLPKHCLLSKGLNLLTEEDLQRLVKHLNLQPDSGDPAETDPPQLTSMISALAQYFCLEVADCLANFQEREETADCLLHDPSAEAVYQDLDPDDKLEFADFGQSLKQRKIRQAQHALGQSRKFMRNFRGRGRGRGRPASKNQYQPLAVHETSIYQYIPVPPSPVRSHWLKLGYCHHGCVLYPPPVVWMSH